MISLAVRRKLRVSEDVLTAALFDYFRARPDTKELSVFLGRVCPFGSTDPAFAFDSYEIELWPEHRAGEPDARVVLRAADETACRIVVEAKLGAPKSGAGPVTEDRTRGDQLARYLLAEAEDHPKASTYLLYLTHHAACPSEDLNASVEATRNANRSDLATRYLWLSWRAVDKFLHDTPVNPILADIRELLRRTGILRFDGFELSRLNSLGTVVFYREQRMTAPIERAYPGMGATLNLGADDFRWRYERRSADGYVWHPPTPTVSGAVFYQGKST